MIGTRRRTLADIAHDRLARAIKSGAYRNGERLPTEHALSAEFNISRPVLRSALQRLREEGLIESRQGAGTFVRHEGLRMPLGFGAPGSDADMEGCHAFRLAVEPAAAGLAAVRWSARDLAEIELAMGRFSGVARAEMHREDADFAFHSAIARASGNRYFEVVLEALEAHICASVQLQVQVFGDDPKVVAAAHSEHRRIHRALRARDAAGAEAAMRGHLEAVSARLAACLPERARRGA